MTPSRLILCCALALSACNGPDLLNDGEYFYVRSEGAVMPVWARGVLSSETFVIILSGGPGTPSHIYIGTEAFDALEARYGVVYWDQRLSGTSQGDAPIESLTIEQLSLDTRLLVETIVHRYAPARLVLLGHSWGGYLGARYLIDFQERDGRIAGWIDMDGVHDYPLGYELSTAWVQVKARERLEAGSEVAFWQEALAWYATDPPYTRENSSRNYDYMEAANGNYIDPDFSPYEAITGRFLFSSPDALFADLMNSPFLQDHFDRRGLSLSEELAQITIPTLLLWGAHDGNVPVGMAEDAMARLGTAPEELHLAILERSAHVPCVEEPERFVEEVVGFIEGL